MRMAIMADLHLNKPTYRNVMDKEFTSLPFRTGDFLRSFEWMINKCVNEIKPDCIVIAGDTYDTFAPNNEVRGFFSVQLKKCIDANIFVIILIGNHDICMRHNALSDIEELKLKNIKIITKPTILDTKQGHRLLLFPYSMDIERKNMTIQEEFSKFLQDVSQKEKVKGKILFFGHFGVQEARINSYKKEVKVNSDDGDDEAGTELVFEAKEYRNRNAHDLTLGDLDSIGAHYIFLGDFHEHQLLKTRSAISMYCGSIEKNNYNEQFQDKGFIVYDDAYEKDLNMGCCKFIKYENCRPMLELKGTIEDMKQYYSTLDLSKYQNAIIKVGFIGDRKQFTVFSSELEDFKDKLIKETNAIHIFLPPPQINDTSLQEAIKKMEEKFKPDSKKVVSIDIMEVVKEMIRERVPEDEVLLVEEMATNIYKQVISTKVK